MTPYVWCFYTFEEMRKNMTFVMPKSVKITPDDFTIILVQFINRGFRGLTEKHSGLVDWSRLPYAR